MAADLEEARYRCPACESKLYGWTAAHDPLDRGRRIVLDRCETCGLAITRGPAPPDVDLELAPLLDGNSEGRIELTAPNRRSFQGGIGGAQWAGLEPELRRLHLNPESLRLLLGERDLELVELRTPYSGRSAKLMWQTLVNAFTLRDNFARNARAGRIPRSTGGEKATYWLDWTVSALVAIPTAIVAYPLEALAAAFGRGGVIEASARPRSEPRG